MGCPLTRDRCDPVAALSFLLSFRWARVASYTLQRVPSKTEPPFASVVPNLIPYPRTDSSSWTSHHASGSQRWFCSPFSPSSRIFGNIRRHLWLSHLRNRGYWRPVSRALECCSTSDNIYGSPTTRIIWAQIKRFAFLVKSRSRQRLLASIYIITIYYKAFFIMEKNMCVCACGCQVCMHAVCLSALSSTCLLWLIKKNSTCPFNLMQTGLGGRTKLKSNAAWEKEAENQQFKFTLNEFHSNWVWTLMKPKFTQSFPWIKAHLF